MSVPFNKFNPFIANLANGGLSLGADSLKIFLTNTAPTVASSKYVDESANEIAAANGYTTGGNIVSIASSAQSGGLYKLLPTGNVTFAASGGSFGPFRYAIIYDSTGSNKYLIGWWDYGSSISVNNGDTFTVSLDTINGIVQLT